MMNTILSTVIFLLVVLCIILIIIILNYRKKIKESARLISKYKDSLNRSYEKDSEFLEKIIAKKIDYLEHSVIPFIDKDNKVVTDEDFDKLIASTVLDIKKTISEPYKEVLNFYISDLDSFVGFELINILQPKFITKNIRRVKGDNSLNIQNKK